MSPSIYTKGERHSLIALAVAGFVGVNGAFIYSLIVDPTTVSQALANPIAAVFIVEALLLVIFFAHFLRKWGLTKMSPALFIVLSLLGSLAFSIPIALMLKPEDVK